MKKLYLIIPLLFAFAYGRCQHHAGGIKANFGVDADVKASFKKFGSGSNGGNSEDWFRMSPATARGVIDTSGAQAHKVALMAGKNVSFTKRMSSAPFSVINGKFWLDGLYTRDFITGNKKDSTSFNSARVGENPALWTGGNNAVSNNVDLVEAFAHLRRDGSTLQDSLWLFAAVATKGNQKDRYVDIELYNKAISYSRTTGKFSTTGLNQGHTEWIFDPTGKLIQMGDVLITIRYTNNNKPVVDIHIWVSKVTRLTSNPYLFKFGSVIHTVGNSPYGYANIIPKTAGVITGTVIANMGTNDTTFSTPWGTERTQNGWGSNYNSKQFAEIGLNLTRIGIDPSSYLLTQSISCTRNYNSILFKSGMYNGDGDDDDRGISYQGRGGDDDDDDGHDHQSCHDEMELVDLADFAGPYSLSTPDVNFTLSGTDTITCRKPVGKIELNPSSEAGKFSWSTVDGAILSTENDNKTANVNKKGWYVVNGKVDNNCPVAKTDLVYVEEDKISPIAQANIEWTDLGEPKLVGGDTTLSNLQTPFGKSKGFEWKWTGPEGFVSTEQSPVVPWEYAWGSFQLTIKEKRNGCVDISQVEFAFRNPEGTGPSFPGPRLGSGKTTLWYYGNALQINTDQPRAGTGKILVYNSNGQKEWEGSLRFSSGSNRFQVPIARGSHLRVVLLYANGQLIRTEKIVF